jgi:hypothetical protein
VCGVLKEIQCNRLVRLLQLISINGKRFGFAFRSSLPLLIAILLFTFLRQCASSCHPLRVLVALLLSLLLSMDFC